MFQEEHLFIFQTIAVILVITVIGVFYVKKKAKEAKKIDDAVYRMRILQAL